MNSRHDLLAIAFVIAFMGGVIFSAVRHKDTETPASTSSVNEPMTDNNGSSVDSSSADPADSSVSISADKDGQPSTGKDEDLVAVDSQKYTEYPKTLNKVLDGTEIGIHSQEDFDKADFGGQTVTYDAENNKVIYKLTTEGEIAQAYDNFYMLAQTRVTNLKAKYADKVSNIWIVTADGTAFQFYVFTDGEDTVDDLTAALLELCGQYEEEFGVTSNGAVTYYKGTQPYGGSIIQTFKYEGE